MPTQMERLKEDAMRAKARSSIDMVSVEPDVILGLIERAQAADRFESAANMLADEIMRLRGIPATLPAHSTGE